MTYAVRLTAALLASSVLVASAGAASAQAAAQPTTPAAPAGTQLSNPGPVIPGVCILDNQRAIATSAVGRAVQTRLQQLGQQVTAELQPQQTTIQTEANQLQTQQATLQQAQLQQRATALQTRYETFQRLVQQRQAEMQQTEVTALRRIATEMQPVVNTVYGQRGCGLLLERGSIVAANPQMDITDAVIQGLNGRIQTFAFERERLPAQGAAAPAAAAPAAAPAARPATPAAGGRR